MRPDFRITWRRCAVGLAFAALLAAPMTGRPAWAQNRQPGAPDGEFSFYGLRFGMRPEEVRVLFPTNASGTEALNPQHGMMFLSFTYDYRNRLSEIRAAYERPSDRLRELALRQVLREKFVQPAAARWKNVTIDIDEGFNRAALTIVMVSSDLRQDSIEHFRQEYLQRLE